MARRDVYRSFALAGDGGGARRRVYEHARSREVLDIDVFIAHRALRGRDAELHAPRAGRRIRGNFYLRGEYALPGQLDGALLPQLAGRPYAHLDGEGLRRFPVLAAHYRKYRNSLAGAEDVARRVTECGISVLSPRHAARVEFVVAAEEARAEGYVRRVAALFGDGHSRHAALVVRVKLYIRKAVRARHALADGLVRVRPERDLRALDGLRRRDGEDARDRALAPHRHGKPQVCDVHRRARLAPRAAHALRDDVEYSALALKQRAQVERAARRLVRTALHGKFLAHDEARKLRRVSAVAEAAARCERDVVVVEPPDYHAQLVVVDALDRDAQRAFGRYYAVGLGETHRGLYVGEYEGAPPVSREAAPREAREAFFDGHLHAVLRPEALGREREAAAVGLDREFLLRRKLDEGRGLREVHRRGRLYYYPSALHRGFGARIAQLHDERALELDRDGLLKAERPRLGWKPRRYREHELLGARRFDGHADFL